MKNPITIILILLACTLTFAGIFGSGKKEPINHKEVCNSSALYILREEFIPPYHEYAFVLLDKDRSYWDWQLHQVSVGDHRQYEPIAPIGKGNFSRVVSARHIPTGEIYAVKVMTHNRTWRTLNEIHILRTLQDAPNFLPILDVLKDEKAGSIALVFELFEKEDYKIMFPKLTDLEIRYFIYETLRTLDYAHSRGIFHRDIKPLNVLMNNTNKNIKVIDWGHADFYFPGKQYSVRVASMYYKGPELLLNYTMYDYSLDIWSTGAMMAAMIFDRIPMFKGKDFPTQLDAIAQVLGTTKLRAYADKYKEDMVTSILDSVGDHPEVPFESFVTPENQHKANKEALDLLKQMLVYDHRRRITAKEAMQHPYFKAFHH